jgi:ABC-2 type transport system permease protein
VADVARKLRVSQQIRLVAGLRWRILRNQLGKKGSRLDLLGMISAAFFAAFLVLGLAFAFFWGAYTSVSTGRFAWMILLFWGIFLFWQVFPIFLAGFGASFEFRNLLRFPLSMSAFYLVGLAYGMADFPSIASFCWLLAMIAGGGVADPSILPTLVPFVFLFMLTNLTLERLIGSWFERLLARRRTRELIFALIIVLSVSVQFLRPFLMHYERGVPAWALRILPYLSVFPPGLAGNGIAAATEGRWDSVTYAGSGLALYLAVFSALLWRRFAAQYRGEELSEADAPSRADGERLAAQDTKPGALDLLPPQVAAVLRKDFRYLTRNGFAAVAFLMPPLLVVLFSSQFAGRHPSVLHRGVSTDLFFPGMMGYLLLMLMMPAYNCFAYEGKGIQTYFTAPLRFGHVLLGKNLMHAGMLLVDVGLSMALLAWRIGLPSLPVLAATLAGALFSVIGQFTIANWTSLNFPRKLEFGSMRGQRNSGVAVWVGFGVQTLLVGICSFVLLLGRWTGSPWLPAAAFAGLAAASAAGYFATLDALSEVAEQKKEVLLEALCR